MNKKSLMGLALVAVVTLTSTSVVAFASQNTEKGTTNVVKVASSNVSENKNSDVEALKTSDEKAIELAKDYLKKYMNVDMDEKMKQDHLSAHVCRDEAKSKVVFVCFQSIDPEKSYETFKKTNTIYHDYKVMIDLKDGKVSGVNAIDGVKLGQGLKCDKEKAKAVTEKFLKDKGLSDGIATIDLLESNYGDVKDIGMACMICKDASGNEAFYVNIDLNTYSVASFVDIKESKSEGFFPNK